MTPTERGYTACTKAEARLRSAVARVVQHDHANATAEINAARDEIAKAKSALDLALIEQDNLRNAALVFARLLNPEQ